MALEHMIVLILVGVATLALVYLGRSSRRGDAIHEQPAAGPEANKKPAKN